MHSIDDLSEKIDRYIETSEKRLKKLESNQNSQKHEIERLKRKDNELERMIANSVEAAILYYHSFDDKLDTILVTLNELPCRRIINEPGGNGKTDTCDVAAGG